MLQCRHFFIDIPSPSSAEMCCIYSVYKKLQATRTKVAPINLIYGSHFSTTEATYKVSQNMENFVEFTRTLTRITHKQLSSSIKNIYIIVYKFSPF